jgi:hypothetical protein
MRLHLTRERLDRGDDAHIPEPRAAAGVLD